MLLRQHLAPGKHLRERSDGGRRLQRKRGTRIRRSGRYRLPKTYAALSLAGRDGSVMHLVAFSLCTDVGCVLRSHLLYHSVDERAWSRWKRTRVNMELHEWETGRSRDCSPQHRMYCSNGHDIRHHNGLFLDCPKSKRALQTHDSNYHFSFMYSC